MLKRFRQRSVGSKTETMCRPRARSWLPFLETLESRRLLTAVYWSSATNGSWDLASNWSTGKVPGADDDVTIDQPGVTVTISSNVESIQSITADDPLVISGGGLTVAANSTISGGLAMTGGTLTATGSQTVVAVTGTTTVSSANLFARNGATLSLPDLTAYAAPGFTTLEATGTASALDLPKLTSVTDASYSDTVEALNGGTVNLASLEELTANVNLESQGQGSVLKIPALVGYNVASAYPPDGPALTAKDGGVIDSGSLTTVTGVIVTLSDTSRISLGQISNIDDSNVIVQDGAVLSLPEVKTDQTPGFATLEATGTGSELDLVNLTSITVASFSDTVEAESGGTVNLAGLVNLTTNVNLEAQGQGSILKIPDLVAFSSGQVYADDGPSLTAQDGGVIDSGSLTTINGVTLTLSDTSSISLGKLSNIDDSSVILQAGAMLSLPGVTSYQAPGSGILEATGTGSVLDLPNLTSVTDGSFRDTVEADNGGTVNLSGLTTLTANMNLEALGQRSILNIPKLMTFSVGSVFAAGGASLTAEGASEFNSGSLTTINGVDVALNDTAVTLANVTDAVITSLALTGGASLSLPLVTAGTIPLSNGQGVEIQGTLVSVPAAGSAGAVINVPQSQGLTLILQNSGTFTQTTFNVGPGTIVELASGKYVGGDVFNVGAGAVVDLTDGGGEILIDPTTTYSGTLQGSGEGTVQLGSGGIIIGNGGMTLNFAGSMFQWSGGEMDAGNGDVTNLGTMNLSGIYQKEFYNDGVLDNFGTIIQTGTGNLVLGTDGTYAATLMIEASAATSSKGMEASPRSPTQALPPGKPLSITRASSARRLAPVRQTYDWWVRSRTLAPSKPIRARSCSLPAWE